MIDYGSKLCTFCPSNFIAVFSVKHRFYISAAKILVRTEHTRIYRVKDIPEVDKTVFDRGTRNSQTKISLQPLGSRASKLNDSPKASPHCTAHFLLQV